MDLVPEFDFACLSEFYDSFKQELFLWFDSQSPPPWSRILLEWMKRTEHLADIVHTLCVVTTDVNQEGAQCGPLLPQCRKPVAKSEFQLPQSSDAMSIWTVMLPLTRTNVSRVILPYLLWRSSIFNWCATRTLVRHEMTHLTQKCKQAVLGRGSQRINMQFRAKQMRKMQTSQGFRAHTALT